jgi:hypothetical protein
MVIYKRSLNILPKISNDVIKRAILMIRAPRKKAIPMLSFNYLPFLPLNVLKALRKMQPKVLNKMFMSSHILRFFM